MKQELLASIIEILDKDDLELTEVVGNTKEPGEALLLIEKYEDFLKGQHRKIINIKEKQEELLKKFKENDEFFSRVGLS